MPYCPKCGTEVKEDMSFCTMCGAPLTGELPSAVVTPEAYRSEKTEKDEKREMREKQEKEEKTEKHEKREMGYVGTLMVGSVIIVSGLMLYLQVTGLLGRRIGWAVFFIIIGVIVILGTTYATIIAKRRHPQV
jgi:cation transport ATPase